MRSLLAAVILAIAMTGGAAAQQKSASAKLIVPKVEAGLAIRASKLPVKETIDAIAKAAEDKGAKVVARVDHASGAKAVGVDMKPSQLLIFGNPKLGTPLMTSNPRAGLALPLKVLAYEDAAGRVWVVNDVPSAIASKFKLKSKTEKDAAKAADGAIAAILSAAAFAL